MKLVSIGSISLLILMSCSTPKKVEAVDVSCIEPDPLGVSCETMKETKEVAAVSAQIEWCEMKYEPFYLAYMQFIRLPSKLGQNQIAYIGVTHGAWLKKNQDNLKSSSACTLDAKKKVQLAAKEKIDSWCSQESLSRGLKAMCDSSKIELNKF